MNEHYKQPDHAAASSAGRQNHAQVCAGTAVVVDFCAALVNRRISRTIASPSPHAFHGPVYTVFALVERLENAPAFFGEMPGPPSMTSITASAAVGAAARGWCANGELMALDKQVAMIASTCSHQLQSARSERTGSGSEFFASHGQRMLLRNARHHGFQIE